MLDNQQTAHLKLTTPDQGDHWQPLFAGELRTRALDTVNDIAQALRAGPHRPLPAELAPEVHGAAMSASLSGGTAGLALFFAYLAQVDFKEDNSVQALGFLEQAMDAVATAPMGPALHGGFTGVGWTVAHLVGRLIEPGDENPNEAIDQFVSSYVSHTPWTTDYDLIGGLVGFGVYALERLPDPSAVTCLEQIINRLDELAEHTDDGITWHTPPDLLPEWQRELCPQGYYNLGLAHGIPGIIALLGNACAAGVATATALPLLAGAVDWLLAQQIADGERAGFPSWAAPGLEPRATRLAWCYGDPGVAAALLAAAHGAQEPAWAQAALTIARRAASRPPEQAGIVDACLCHGAAGLGHLFNRMYQATGDASLREAAQYWLQYTLDFRKPDVGIAGYLAWEPGEEKASPWTADPGFLVGAAGVGLALLAAATAVEPAWDRSLMVNIPS